MGNIIDLTGQRFGRLVVIECAGRTKQRNGLWRCKCDCGTIVLASQSNLNKGTKEWGGTKSCGCLKADSGRDQLTTHGLSKDDSGQQSRLYGIWCDMRRRCFDPDTKYYYRYGGRGITVCDEWLQFPPFYLWAITNGYRADLTLDRKKNDEGYCPSNCRWVTMKVQQNNRSDNHSITFNNLTLTMTEWAEARGLKVGTLGFRLRTGWSVERALTTPLRKGYGRP